MFDSILLTETLRERAGANSLSIDLALAVTGGGYFDYMVKSVLTFVLWGVEVSSTNRTLF